jgi:hypothetical protein
MIRQNTGTLPELYESDETAWLDAMSDLLREGRFDDLDYAHLREFLADMARRDRRELKSRLKILLRHMLKWTYQPDQRTPSWRGTITNQRQDLVDTLSSGTLRNHADAIFGETYADAVEWAIDETDLPAQTFPAGCPWTLDQLLSADVLGRMKDEGLNQALPISSFILHPSDYGSVESVLTRPGKRSGAAMSMIPTPFFELNTFQNRLKLKTV